MRQLKVCKPAFFRIVFIICVLSLVGNVFECFSVKSFIFERTSVFGLGQNTVTEDIGLASSSYDYGIQVGRAYSRQYHFLSNLVWNDRSIRQNFKNTLHQIQHLESTLQYYFPSFFEELQGLSRGANIPLERLLFVQLTLSDFFRGECTVTMATGKATRDNETFLTFNIDAPVETLRDIFWKTVVNRLLSLRCRMVRLNTLEYRYVYWGIPIVYEMPFLNDKGLGWGSPGTVFTKENRTIDKGPGIATMLLEKLAMMTCKNVSQVAALYKNIERASPKSDEWFHMYDSSTSCFCDREGGILAIEQTHSYIITVFGNSTEITGAPEGILWHANHHQWLDPNLTGSVRLDEDESSALRAKQTRMLLLKNYGNITLDVCINITKDHSGGFDPENKDSGDICRHPDRKNKKVTVFSWIILPKELTVYWTHTSPCKGFFWKHDFSNIFC